MIVCCSPFLVGHTSGHAAELESCHARAPTCIPIEKDFAVGPLASSVLAAMASMETDSHELPKIRLLSCMATVMVHESITRAFHRLQEH